MSAKLLTSTVLIATVLGFNKTIPLKKKPFKKSNLSDVDDQIHNPPSNKKPPIQMDTTQFFYSQIGLNITNTTDTTTNNKTSTFYDTKFNLIPKTDDNDTNSDLKSPSHIKLRLGTAISGGYVECTATQCYIDCSGTFGCSNITINATQSKYLYLSCGDYSSCNSINIEAAQSETSIHCNGKYSCLASNIIGFNDALSTIELDCKAEHSCAGIHISSLSTELIMNCNSHYSCYESIIYLSYEYMHLSTFYCNEYDYNCYNIIFYIDKYEQDAIASNFGSIIYSSYYEDLNIICNNGASEFVCDELTFCSNDLNLSDILTFLIFDNDTNRFVCEEDNNCCFYSVDNQIEPDVFAEPNGFVYSTTQMNISNTWSSYTKQAENNDLEIIFIVFGSFVLVFIICIGFYCVYKSRNKIENVQTNMKTDLEEYSEGNMDENDILLIEEEYVNKLKDLASFISKHPGIVAHGKDGCVDVMESTLNTTITDVYESTKYSHLDTKQQIGDIDMKITEIDVCCYA
eukprot:107672_1